MKTTVTLVIDQIENADNDISGNDNNNDDNSGGSNKELSRNENDEKKPQQNKICNDYILLHSTGQTPNSNPAWCMN